jgi:hypothetical protein
MTGDVSLLPPVLSWTTQDAYIYFTCLKLAIYESELPVGSESPDEQMVAVRQGEFRLISFLWFPGDA